MFLIGYITVTFVKPLLMLWALLKSKGITTYRNYTITNKKKSIALILIGFDICSEFEEVGRKVNKNCS